MAKQLDSSIDIDARPERVWEVLTDFGAYPEWNPFIVRADGTPAEGSRLTVRMQPVGARGVTLTPTVLEVAERHRRMASHRRTAMTSRGAPDQPSGSPV